MPVALGIAEDSWALNICAMPTAADLEEAVPHL
jgi:hypothetical protein